MLRGRGVALILVADRRRVWWFRPQREANRDDSCCEADPRGGPVLRERGSRPRRLRSRPRLPRRVHRTSRLRGDRGCGRTHAAREGQDTQAARRPAQEARNGGRRQRRGGRGRGDIPRAGGRQVRTCAQASWTGSRSSSSTESPPRRPPSYRRSMMPTTGSTSSMRATGRRATPSSCVSFATASPTPRTRYPTPGPYGPGPAIRSSSRSSPRTIPSGTASASRSGAASRRSRATSSTRAR